MKKLVFQMLQEEMWWGGSVVYAPMQPYDQETSIKLNVEQTGRNQSAPFFLSSKGRYIWDDTPIRCISFENGTAGGFWTLFYRALFRIFNKKPLLYGQKSGERL